MKPGEYYKINGRPYYGDEFGNPVTVGDTVLLAPSQSGYLTLRTVTRIEPRAGHPSIRVWSRPFSGGPEREIRWYATTPYTGKLPS